MIRFFAVKFTILIVYIFLSFSNTWAYESLSMHEKEMFYRVTLLVDKKDSKDFKKSLKIGIKSLLVRLTGNKKALLDSRYNLFLTKPSKWLKSYIYRENTSDDEATTQYLVMQFDRKRILQQLKKVDLNIWAIENRPHLLVVADYVTATGNLSLNNNILEKYKNLDYRAVGKHWGFNLHSATSYAGDINELQAEMSNKIQGIVKFKIQKISDYYSLNYKLYDATGVRKTNTIYSKVKDIKLISKTLYKKMFSELSEYFSKIYYAKVSDIHESLLVINGLTTIKDIIKVEKALKNMEPILYQVILYKLKSGEVTFKVSYHGSMSSMKNRLNKIHDLNILNSNSVEEIHATYK